MSRKITVRLLAAGLVGGLTLTGGLAAAGVLPGSAPDATEVAEQVDLDAPSLDTDLALPTDDSDLADDLADTADDSDGADQDVVVPEGGSPESGVPVDPPVVPEAPDTEIPTSPPTTSPA
ncbi:MAG: hypothetical protein ACRDV9_10380, partial [Acidimicrobiia bacterium]